MRNSLTTPLALRRTGSTPGVVAARVGSTPGAFTLIEILVALAVLVLMMSIILVPINMGLNVFHIGKARVEVQQANQLVLNQLASELKRAVFVFPNEQMPGITNKAPYLANGEKPYYNTAGAGTFVDNTSRLDFLLPATNNGIILTPPRADNYVVSYYARRLDNTKSYDVFSNPIVLWRAQYAYREDGANPFSSYTPTNTNATNLRYPIGAAPYDGKVWLTQNAQDEPDLSTVSIDSTTTILASHTLITPRDMALVASNANAASPSYQPDSSFICDDANNDGKIDRVTMSLLLQKYDSLGAADDKSQQIRSTQSVALPNIK